MARPVVVKKGSIDVRASLLAHAKAMHEQLERDTKRGRKALAKVAGACAVGVAPAYGVADVATAGDTDDTDIRYQKLFARLFGAPRTKKNHGKVIWRKVKGKQRRFHVPSDAYVKWCNAVVAQLVAAPQMPDRAYNCKAVFYRDANSGDAVGYYQGLADALEAAGVVSDDKLITQWDGSRLRVDRANPRVELTLTPVEEG